jgi:hypothetical protein
MKFPRDAVSVCSQEDDSRRKPSILAYGGYFRVSFSDNSGSKPFNLTFTRQEIQLRNFGEHQTD